MPSTMTSKGQVTIPKGVRDRLKLRPNDRVDFVEKEGQIVLVPVKTLKDLRGAVLSRGKGDFTAERARAKKAVGKRVAGEME